MSAPRIASLLPSATEIVAALGLADRLVARSHECDWPASVRSLPVCTRPNLSTDAPSAEIHARVGALLEAALAIYQLDVAVLAKARPSHILTQDRCAVCAVSLEQVEEAALSVLGAPAKIISLEPARLGDVWADIRRVGRALGVEADGVCRALTRRVAEIAMRAEPAARAGRPRVAAIEWCEPLMAAGNWVPELIEIAGGEAAFGTAGAHSPFMPFEALGAADVIVFMPCGYDLERTLAEARALIATPAWAALAAVAEGQVFAVDGSAYFNRPGPRLVDSLEILAEILHPESFDFGHTAWRRVA